MFTHYPLFLRYIWFQEVLTRFLDEAQANGLLKYSDEEKSNKYMKKVSLFVLLIISFAISRFLFFLVDDPEGPNLLLVTALAVVIFMPASLIYLKVSKNK